MQESNQELEIFVPSSREVKLVVLCYMLIGLLAVLSRREMDEYLSFHVRQSVGRRLVFMFVLLVSLVLLFIPFVKWIPIVVFIALLSIWRYMVYKARGKGYGKSEFAYIGVFYALGSWFMGLVEDGEVSDDG